MADVITSIVTTTVTAKPAATSSSSRANHQGGILEGANPSNFNPKDPITMFIIQAGIIIIFCRLLHYPLSKLKQPRVIAEIIGGILLGPSVMGRIPGFTSHIFPAPSMPILSLVANLGLVLFLFLVGLEVDLRLLVSNWKIALGVGAAGMALPFGLGCAIAYGLYHQFRGDEGLEPIGFGTFMLFVGVAMAITAFPVLCRILTELKLLQSQVGIVVLSAGVGNDVVGWILLALCVALVNAGTGITALYVLLTCVAYVLFLIFAVRPIFRWILQRSGSLRDGPSQTVVGLTILMTLASAFFTGIIGVHPIFGAFLVGLICPHEGGFAIKLTEKIEDLVSVFFLPLYFALSGLSTNIGLLDSPITWGYVFGVIFVAFFGKFIGGTIAARLSKLVWRESFTIGILMSCKGLVELIVLNIGYSAKILSQRTFTIFVVMALVTTFATTPLVSALYPPWYQKKLAAWKRGEIDWDGNRLVPGSNLSEHGDSSLEKQGRHEIRRLLVYLRLDSLPSLFTFVALLGGDQAGLLVKKIHPQKERESTQEDHSGETLPSSKSNKRPLEVHGLRIRDLTERLSSVMKESEVEEFSTMDPVVNAFHTFGQLHNVAVSGEVQIVPEGSYADILTATASAQASDMVLLPWSESGALVEEGYPFLESAQTFFTSVSHNQFITKFLDTVPCNAAIFVNQGFGALPRSEPKPLHRVATNLSMRSTAGQPTAPILDRSHHIFFPFFGGPDDRVALRFVLRLAQNSSVTATILGITRGEAAGESDHTASAQSNQEATGSTSPSAEEVFLAAIRDSLPPELEPRVLFDTLSSAQPLSDAVSRAAADIGLTPKNAGDLVVIGRSHDPSRLGLKAGRPPLGPLSPTNIATTAARQCLGDAAESMLAVELKASVLVIQAGKGEADRFE